MYELAVVEKILTSTSGAYPQVSGEKQLVARQMW